MFYSDGVVSANTRTEYINFNCFITFTSKIDSISKVNLDIKLILCIVKDITIFTSKVVK